MEKFSAYDCEVAVSALSQEMILALAFHGFKQKLGDAAAMTKDEKTALGSEAAIAEKIAEKRQTIVQNLLAGIFAAGGSQGPRLRGIDAVMHEVAVEVLKGAFGAKGLSWPSGKGSAETIRDLAGKYIAKNEASVRKEAERRMAQAAKAADTLDGII